MKSVFRDINDALMHREGLKGIRYISLYVNEIHCYTHHINQYMVMRAKHILTKITAVDINYLINIESLI